MLDEDEMKNLRQFKLTAEQRDQVRACSRAASHKLTAEQGEVLLRGIEDAIFQYHHANRGPTAANIRAELRALLTLCRSSRPPIEDIRKRTLSLSSEAFRVLELHASRTLPMMFPVFHYDGNLRHWLEYIASDDILVTAIQALLEKGGAGNVGVNVGTVTAQGTSWSQ